MKVAVGSMPTWPPLWLTSARRVSDVPAARREPALQVHANRDKQIVPRPRTTLRGELSGLRTLATVSRAPFFS
jgi:hypothetical protein